MTQLRIIARYQDGRVLKGHTNNFHAERLAFHLHPVDQPEPDVRGIEVRLNELKAIFVVRTFDGDPDYREPKNLDEIEPASGTTLRITFRDNETLVGSTHKYDIHAIGSFLFPVDHNDNNTRVFVINAFVKSIEFMDVAKAG